MAGTSIDSRPSMVSAPTSEARLIRYDTDRSSEPARIATVWPTATMPRATLRWRMFVRLPLAKNVPPSRVTTSQPTATMATSAAQMGVPAIASRDAGRHAVHRLVGVVARRPAR